MAPSPPPSPTVKDTTCYLLFGVCVRGVPAVVDFAAMRDAIKRLGGDPAKINPLCPVDLVIDHSVQVDVSRRYDYNNLCKQLSVLLILKLDLNKLYFSIH